MKKVNFREFETGSGKLVLAGKTAENNEKSIKQVEESEIVLHTKAAGSPFVNIKNNGKKESKKDIKEAAIFCAAYSKDWRDNKSDVIVHYFRGKDIYKSKGMKTGTFGVKKVKIIKVKKEKIEEFKK